MKSTYLSHPENTYGTSFEKQVIERIQLAFPITKIFHRNLPEKSQLPRDQYFQQVCNFVSQGVFLSFLDGAFSNQDRQEMDYLLKRGLPIYQINTRLGFKKIKSLDSLMILTPEQLKQRLYIDGERKNGTKNYFEIP